MVLSSKVDRYRFLLVRNGVRVARKRSSLNTIGLVFSLDV